MLKNTKKIWQRMRWYMITGASRLLLCWFCLSKDRSENMIKNEYMKLSRDASQKGRRKVYGSGTRLGAGDSDVEVEEETVSD